MIEWISNWAQGIIIAVIITTIIEMILPNGNIKKYIRVVLGIYILITIISPLIEKTTSQKIDFNEIIDNSIYQNEIEKSDNKIAQKLNSNNNRTVKDIYIENLENDIKYKLKQKGYITTNMYIKAKDEAQNYEIERIELYLIKDNNEKENNQINTIQIQVNEINSNSVGKNENTKQMQEKDKKEVQKYLADTYMIKPNLIYLY